MVAEQKRKPSWKALFLLVIFFIGIAVAVFFTSPLSEVRSVQVVGNSQIPTDQIVSASGIQVGMNFWEVEPATVDKQLKSQFALIAKADVEVNFPGNVVIAVAEKPVSAILIHKGGIYYRLLSDGTVFDTVKSLNGTSLPLLVSDRSFPVEQGKQIPDPDIQKFCEQIVKTERALLDHVSDFSLQKGNLWSARTTEGFEIRFPPGDVSTTLAVYVKFWKKQLETKPPGIIYIFSPEEAWYEQRPTQDYKKE